MHIVPRVNVSFSTTYHILLAEFEELLIELHTLKLTIAFIKGSPTYPPLG